MIKLESLQIFLRDWTIIWEYTIAFCQEDMFAKLSGWKVFSKLDLSKVYHQISVNKECAMYLTINKKKGSYKFNRLPFSIKVEQGIFQQIMDTLLNDVDFMIAYLDDTLIESVSQE